MSLVALELIDRTIDLLRRREELNRRTLNEMVAPLLAAFEEVHRDYLITFRKYFDRLTRQNANNYEGVIDEIIADSLFSTNLRDRVRLMADALPDPRLQPFVTAIVRYLQVASTGPLEATPRDLVDRDDEDVLEVRGYHNIGRAFAVSELKSIAGMQLPQSDRSVLAALTIEQLVRRLQALHSRVAEAYVALTVDLLRGKRHGNARRRLTSR